MGELSRTESVFMNDVRHQSENTKETVRGRDLVEMLSSDVIGASPNCHFGLKIRAPMVEAPTLPTLIRSRILW